MSKLAAAALAVALLAGTAAAAPAGSYDLLATFRTQLPQLKRHTAVAILLPKTLQVAGAAPRPYATGAADRGGWLLELAGAPSCGSANACFLASFEGRKGKPLPGKPNLRLAGGDAALYQAITCGASCAPASLWFGHNGVLYSWQVKDPPRNARVVLAQLANEAIAAGPR